MDSFVAPDYVWHNEWMYPIYLMMKLLSSLLAFVFFVYFYMNLRLVFSITYFGIQLVISFSLISLGK